MKIPVFIKIESLTKNKFHLVRLDRIINVAPYSPKSTGESTVYFERSTAEGTQTFEVYSLETVEEIHETINYKISTLEYGKEH